MIEIKKCENCYHFCQHYVRGKKRFAALACGHCRKKFHKRHTPNEKGCQNWQPVEQRKEENALSLKSTLLKMSEQLNQIAEVIEDICREQNAQTE